MTPEMQKEDMRAERKERSGEVQKRTAEGWKGTQGLHSGFTFRKHVHIHQL